MTLGAVHAGAGTPEDLAGVDVRDKLVLIEPAPGTPGGEIGRRVADIKNAGGRFVLLLLGEPVWLEPPALPTLFSPNRATGARFATLVKAGGATAEYVNRPVTNLRYELAYGVEHHVTTPQVYRPKTRDLVAVRTEYFTPGTWQLMWYSPRNGELFDTMRLVAGQPARIAWKRNRDRGHGGRTASSTCGCRCTATPRAGRDHCPRTVSTPARSACTGTASWSPSRRLPTRFRR